MAKGGFFLHPNLYPVLQIITFFSLINLYAVVVENIEIKIYSVTSNFFFISASARTPNFPLMFYFFHSLCFVSPSLFH